MSAPTQRLTGERITYERFVHRQRKFTVPRPGLPDEHVSFKFEDDKWHLWDVLKPSERTGNATVNFSELPAWLFNDAKSFIAHLWLETSTYANELQQAMTSLRILGRILSDFSGRPIDLRKKHALQFQRSFKEKGYSANYHKTVFGFVNYFLSFVRQQYPEVTSNDFIIEVSRRKGRSQTNQPLGQSPQKKIPTEILAAIIDACEADLEAYLEAKRNYTYPDRSECPKEYEQATRRAYNLRRKEGLARQPPSERSPDLRALHGRAIKAQVVKLSICVGRRISAVCNSLVKIRTEKLEWANEAGILENVVMVRFREMKIRNVDEDVACPGAFGELAVNAIETAKELTTELRIMNTEWSDRLFLIQARKGKSAQVVSPAQINQYLNGANGTKSQKKGLRQRYNIPCAKITTQNFRLTRGTNLWLGGMQVHEVSDDLGHRGTEMAIRYYVVGTEESMRRYQSFINHQALSGAIMDFVGGQEVVHTRLSARHVEIMKNFGLIVVPTRYGYCARHASLGPCDRTTPCYTGVDGIECDFHVLSPDALPALLEDKEVAEANISTYKDNSEYSSWVTNNRNQLVVINKRIDEASALQQQINCNRGCNKCNQSATAEG